MLERGKVDNKVAQQSLVFPLHEEEFVSIPGGIFTMESGENQTEQSELSSLEQHQVCPFEMMKRPVTFSQFEQYCAENGVMPPEDEGWGRGEQPLINVSYWEARQYCFWLNSKQRDYIYRLPTELEWEFVCRAGADSIHWKQGDAGNARKQRRTCVHTGRDFLVGLLPTNPWGLFDMHGNIWEWCASDADKQLNTEDIAAQSSKGRFLAYRGGAWYQVSSFLRSVYRKMNRPESKDYSLGFRLARNRP